jgi:hypothetical protein
MLILSSSCFSIHYCKLRRDHDPGVAYSSLARTLTKTQSVSTYMPHINPHRTCPIPLQNSHTHHVIQPRIRAIRARFKLPSQHRAPIRQREPLRYNNHIRAVVCPNRISGVRANHALCVGEAPVGAEVEDGAWGGWLGDVIAEN